MKKILPAVVSLSLFCPICDVHAVRRLEPPYLGFVAKYIPENDKRNFEQVSKNCSVGLDCSGYVNTYLELYDTVMRNCKERDFLYYKITTPEDFLKIYDLLNNTQFKILHTTVPDNHDFIYVCLPATHSAWGYYVLFPSNYGNLEHLDNPIYSEELKLTYQKHLRALCQFEQKLPSEMASAINPHCIRPEVFFQICFEINEEMYPNRCAAEAMKNEFRARLQDFLVKQTICWTNFMSYSPDIKKIPNPNEFLTLKELDFLRENLAKRLFGCRIEEENTSLKTSFVNTQDPDDVFNGKVYDFQIQHVIDGLWNQNKLTKNYSYVADVNGKKLKITPDETGTIEELGCSNIAAVSSSSDLAEWKTYKSGQTIISSAGSQHHPISKMCKKWRMTFDWLCGLDYKNFQKDFNEFVCNCDAYKIYKIKNNLLESFEYLSGIRENGEDTPTDLRYLGEVLFEDENDKTCVSYDGILNLLYIFDFFKFPTNVTNKIIEYVLSKTIETCKNTTTLYNADKFKEIAKLVKKLWDWNINNENSSDSQKSIVSEILENYESNTLNNIINKAN